jgi:hypothetical protein
VENLLPLLDRLLAPHAVTIGDDFIAYRNHACRVASFHCVMERAARRDPHKLAVAAAYHDLGIWSAGTFDYIEPSIHAAVEFLREESRQDLVDEVAAMIRDHHKVTPCGDRAPPGADVFRRADWVDVSAGLLRFGIPRDTIADVRRRFPNAGFHKLLLKLSAKRLVRHPLSPLPMLRW